MSPVAPGVEIAEEELLLQPVRNRGHRARDLPGHESLASDRTLVVEKDPGRRMHAVSLAIVDRDPVRVKLRSRVRRARIERRRLLLRSFSGLPEQLGGRGLIETRLAFPPQNANG